MISKVSISNFKSVYQQEIELGRVNVFIGENGCGKSNILEAIAMVAASKSGDLNNEGLFNRGVRVTKPSLTFSSFLGAKTTTNIKLSLIYFENALISSELSCDNADDIYALWKDKDGSYLDSAFTNELDDERQKIKNNIDALLEAKADEEIKDSITNLRRILKRITYIESDIKNFYEKRLALDYLIYNINTTALRGLISESRKQPLGINGEGLDVLLSTFTKEQIEELKQFNFISWLKDIHIDIGDTLKINGYKLGRSNSDLYFTDKFMQKKNNTFAAENANEGALHVLFYLALMISERTPKFFAIDNIENALNPLLCRQLMTAVTQLAKKYDKQVLITTHNPAVLDGLNLFDEEQHLFVVKRSDEGHTKVERLRLKPETQNGKMKLSELWMRGYLGAVPSNIF